MDGFQVYAFPDFYIEYNNEWAVAERLTGGDVYRLREKCDLVEFNQVLTILQVQQEVNDKLNPKGK
jgi:hypothetical protein